MVGTFHFRMGQGIDEFHRLPTVGPPNVHALDGIALVHEFGRFNDERVPLVEILALRRDTSLRFPVAHGLWADFGFIKMTLHLRPYRWTS